MISHPSLSPPPLSASSRPQLHSTQSFRAEPAPAALSPLTTRSSSTTRLSTHLEWDAPTKPPLDGSSDGYRAWRREGLERKLQVGDKGNGRGQAVVTIAGVPSSGASSSSEGSPPQPFLMGLNRMQDLVEGDVLPVFEGRERGRGRQGRVVPLSPGDVLKWQVKQTSPPAPAQNFDNLLQYGIGDYSYVLTPETPHSPRSPPTPRSPQQARSGRGKNEPPSTEPEPHPRRVSLGKGKFSEVLLVRKGGVEYALKHTPLHPHHPLIATRLLREPTILAQLMPHPNLVEVYETIRTPGHFYLVEENLSDHVTLEGLVGSSAGGILSDELAWSVLDQLASVVRSLHEPLRVCHRDIKPENILVRLTHPASPSSSLSPSPPASPSSSPLARSLSDTPSGARLALKLLDFGLATHFSASEAKLSTCCGSPAYHSPELWRALRESPGGLRYWGPEVDIWCVGLTLLRCLTPQKYPLGINHSSLAAIGHRVTDSILAVRNAEFRAILTGLLDLDGERRMAAFSALVKKRDLEPSWLTGSPQTPLTPGSVQTTTTAERQAAPPRPEFKSTTFIPTPPKHGLDLPLLASSQLPDGPRPLEVHAGTDDLAVEGASCQAPPPPVELVLLNPTDEPIRRAASYVKYALRCAGVLYHVREDASALEVDGRDEDEFRAVLECAVPLPKEAAVGASKASHALIAALRPAGPIRSSSVPAVRAGGQGQGAGGGGGKSKKEPPPPPVPTLRFFLSIRRSAGPATSKAQKRRSAAPVVSRVVITLSDARARGVVRDALKLDHFDSPVMHSPRIANSPLPTPGLAGDDNGRRGRGARGEVPTIRTDGSGSRAARDRRRSSTTVGIRDGLGAGLAMAMGPPAVREDDGEGRRGKGAGGGAVTGPLPSAGASGGKGGGFFEFATGYFSSRSSVAGTPAGTPGVA